MPKKKPAKTKSVSNSWIANIKHPLVFYKSLSRWYKLLVIFGVLVLGLIVAINGSNFFEQRRLENSFRQIDSDINALHIDNTKFQKDKYCRRAEVKFDEGWLYCAISIKNKTVLGVQDATDFIASFKDSRGWQLESSIDLSKPLDSVQAINTQTGGSCDIRTSVNHRTNTVNLEFLCVENSLKSFYPYQE